METTLVMIKPDCVQKRMIGSIIGALENSGMTISEMKYTTLTKKEASDLYKEHKGKWHFDRNIKHVTSGGCSDPDRVYDELSAVGFNGPKKLAVAV